MLIVFIFPVVLLNDITFLLLIYVQKNLKTDFRFIMIMIGIELEQVE